MSPAFFRTSGHRFSLSHAFSLRAASLAEEQPGPVNYRHGRRSVENPGVLIRLGGPEAGGRTGLLRGTDRSLTVAAPSILAKAHGRSRLSLAYRKGVREQEAEPGTPVTGQVSGLLLRHAPSENQRFSFLWVGLGPAAVTSGRRFLGNAGT